MTRIMLVLALFCAISCGKKDRNSQNSASSGTTTENNSDKRPIIFLEAAYATSNAAGKPVQHLFDDDPTSFWQTQTGAGPDEGVMIYFQDALPLGTIKVIPADGSFMSGATNEIVPVLQYFVNGQSMARGMPGDAVALGETNVKSLYIRIESTGTETIIKKKNKEGNLQIYQYPPTGSVSFKAIEITNNKGEVLRIHAPKQVGGQVVSTSTLAPASAYHASNLFDARKEFVWVEGNASSNGEGETIEFQFENDVHISAIQIWNGYQRSDEHFSANARLKDFEFKVETGSGNSYTLRDTKGGQKIDLSAALTGKKFTLTIKSAYPGAKYKDLALSEIVFYDGIQPLALHSNWTNTFDASIKSQTASSPLSSMLNKRLNNFTERDMAIDQSIILRSDGTFVMYRLEGPLEEGGETEVEILADGNWELLNANAQSASVKVFGRWNNLSQISDYYAGSSTQEVTRIFQDQLTIDAEKVKGTKMIGVFYR